jgi:hypothetical protein
MIKKLSEFVMRNSNLHYNTSLFIINVMGTRKDNSPVINCDSYREQSRGLIIRRGGVPPMQLQFNKNQVTNLFPVLITGELSFLVPITLIYLFVCG